MKVCVDKSLCAWKDLMRRCATCARARVNRRSIELVEHHVGGASVHWSPHVVSEKRETQNMLSITNCRESKDTNPKGGELNFGVVRCGGGPPHLEVGRCACGGQPHSGVGVSLIWVWVVVGGSATYGVCRCVGSVSFESGSLGGVSLIWSGSL